MTDYGVKPYDVTWIMFAVALYAGLTMVTNVPSTASRTSG